MSRDALYEQAVAEYGPALERLARSYEADAEKRRDLLQEIHLATWRSLESFAGHCSLRTWVYRVAHNVAASHVLRHRRANAHPLVSLDDVELAAETTGFRMSPDDIRRRMEQMEKKMRRATIDVYIATTLCSLVVIAMAAIKPSLLQTIGAALSVFGFAFIVREMRRGWLASPPADVPALEFHRARLQHQLDYHRSRLWLRVACISPGPLLFMTGFALAHPKLAMIMYAQITTFIAIVIAMFPLNRRMSAKVQREIEELGRLTQ